MVLEVCMFVYMLYFILARNAVVQVIHSVCTCMIAEAIMLGNLTVEIDAA